MPTHDKQGRTYARLSDLKPGDLVQVDAGFDCIPAGDLRNVRFDGHAPYIQCTKGRHYLSSDSNTGEIVGVYPSSKTEAAS